MYFFLKLKKKGFSCSKLENGHPAQLYPLVLLNHSCFAYNLALVDPNLSFLWSTKFNNIVIVALSLALPLVHKTLPLVHKTRATFFDRLIRLPSYCPPNSISCPSCLTSLHVQGAIGPPLARDSGIDSSISPNSTSPPAYKVFLNKNLPPKFS